MALEVNPSGVKTIHYSADGTDDSYTAINGTVVEAEGLEENLISQQTTRGSYQSGASIFPKIRVADFQDLATIRAFAVGSSRAAKYIAVEFFEGNEKFLATTEAVYLQVREVPKARRADGDNLWEISFELDADAPWERKSAITS